MIEFFLGLGIAIALAGAAYYYWAKRVEAQIVEGAETAWARYEADEPEMIAGVSKEMFRDLYRKSAFPRFPKYFLISVIAFALTLPAVFAILSGLLWSADQLGLTTQPAELAKYVPLGETNDAAEREQRETVALYLARNFAGFYYFFGVIAAWMGIVALVMRNYHQTRPGSLRDQLLLARADTQTKKPEPLTTPSTESETDTSSEASTNVSENSKDKEITPMRYLHTMVRVADLEASLNFYRDLLGLVEVKRYDSEKGRFTLVFLASPEDETRARSNNAPVLELTYNWDPEEYEGGRNFGHLAYEVDDIYGFCQRLMDNGVTINRPPRDGHMAFVRSPDGISIELLQKGENLPPKSPWVDMANTGEW